MLDEAGSMDFTEEMLALVDQLWGTYEQAQGRAEGRREQLVGLAYILAVLRQDLDTLWEQVSSAPEVCDLGLARRLAQELGAIDPRRAAAAREALRRRGWLA